MSFLQRVQKVSDAHYVLPRVGDMRVDVHAYLSEPLFDQTNEPLWRQAAQAAAYPGMIGLYLMPDTHLGYGIPVGGVAVTEDVIIQAGSGYDISCGVVYLRVPGLHASDIADWDKRRAWIDDVELWIATGIGSRRPKHMPRLAESKVEEILRYGAKAVGVQADVYRDGTTHVIFEPEDFIARLAALVPKPRAHLTRYYGVFAPASPDRPKVVPRTHAVDSNRTAESSELLGTDRQRSLTWAQRLKRVFAIDIEVCRRCGGQLKVIASIEDPPVIERILEHLGHTAEPVDPANPSRAPPQGDLLI